MAIINRYLEEEEKEETPKPSPDADTVILFTKPSNQGLFIALSSGDKSNSGNFISNCNIFIVHWFISNISVTKKMKDLENSEDWKLGACV